MTLTFRAPRQEWPLVSVIIPVWNDATRLKRCLDHLSQQTLPRDRFEVIVVDNGSADTSRAVAEETAGVVVLHEPEPGSYNARNTGLRVARGEVIAFTDADCVPDPEWLERSLARLRAEPEIAILAGAITLFDEDVEDDGDRPTPALLYERAFGFDQRSNAARGLCVTANWVSPAPVIARVGGFDASLRSGGDFHLARTISSAGGKVVFDDDAVVRHPARSSMRALIEKRRRVIGGTWLNRQGNLRGLRIVASAVREALRKTHRILLDSGRSARERAVIVAVIWIIVAVTSIEVTRLGLGFTPLR